MRVLVFVGLLCAVQIESQSNFWDYSQNFLTKLLRQGKNSVERIVTSTPVPTTKVVTNTSLPTKITTPYTTIFFTNKTQSSPPATPSTTATFTSTQTESSIITKTYTSTATSTTPFTSTLSDFSTASTIFDTTTPDFVATTGEPRENPNSHDFYLPHIKREKPHIKMSSNISQVSNFCIFIYLVGTYNAKLSFFFKYGFIYFFALYLFWPVDQWIILKFATNLTPF